MIYNKEGKEYFGVGIGESVKLNIDGYPKIKGTIVEVRTGKDKADEREGAEIVVKFEESVKKKRFRDFLFFLRCLDKNKNNFLHLRIYEIERGVDK